VKSHTFNGTRYLVESEFKLGGYAEVPCRGTTPELYIDPTLKGCQHLEVAVHEALHAAFLAAPEELVRVSARDIGRFLWRLGYRRI